MAKRPEIQVTDAEWEVMLGVWRREEQTAGEVIAHVSESRDWNHRTIRTLLTRLVEKGAVVARVEGSRHFYSAAVTRDACVRSASKSFAQRFFAGDLKSMLLHFVENEELSEEELDQLRKSLDAQKRQRFAASRKRKKK